MADENPDDKTTDTIPADDGKTVIPPGDDTVAGGQGQDTVPADKGADTVPADDKETKVDPEPWADAGTPGGNDTMAYLQSTGISQDDAKALLFDAVKANDLTKIDKEALAAKVGGEAAANIVMQGLQSHIDAVKARTAEVLTAINEEVGGQQSWEKIRTWARGKLPEATINEYIAMIDKGGRFARLAAKDLKEQYVADGNTDPTNKEVTPKANGQTVDTTQNTPLSRREYFETLDRHNRKGTLTPELRAQLLKRRQAK